MITPTYPCGIKAAQNWEQIIAYIELIEQYDITLFIEIGIHLGGLAALMIARTRHISNFIYLGLEIDLGKIQPSVLEQAEASPRAKIVQCDALSQWARDMVGDAIKNTHRALVLCDGGDKPAEIKTYAPLLKANDLITAHDYGIEIHDTDLAFLDEDFEEIEPYRQAADLPVYRKAT